MTSDRQSKGQPDPIHCERTADYRKRRTSI
jgi:hypothetical protein